jgi:hypothetical protein
MRSILHLLVISASLILAGGQASAEPGRDSAEAPGESQAAKSDDSESYDPRKHHVDKRNLANRPVWWWTHPMCRPKLRHLGNCKLDSAGPKIETNRDHR